MSTQAVIIPTIGRAHLKNTVSSCLNQINMFNEIIIVNDSGEALKEEFSSANIKVLNTNGRQGANKARNLGIMSAKSEFVTFLDDDDLFLPSRCLDQMNVDIDFYSFLSVKIQNDATANVQPIRKSIQFDTLRYGNVIGAAPVVRTDIAQDVLFDPNIKKGQDWDFNIRVIKSLGSCRQIPKINHISIHHKGTRISTSISDLNLLQVNEKNNLGTLSKLKIYLKHYLF